MPRHPDPAFAAVLNKLLDSRSLSQADFARKLNVSPTQVSRWKRGLEVPSINRIDAISSFFGVDRDTLERLAGWRDNTMAGAQDTIDPEMAAMLDTEKAGLQEDLSGTPPAFWLTILSAQRAARQVAVASVKTAIELAQGQPINTPPPTTISTPGGRRRADRDRNPSAPKRPLTGAYDPPQAYQHFANARALATA